MKTITKNPDVLKRVFAIIFLSVFMVTGIFGQKSVSYEIFLNARRFGHSLPEVVDSWVKESECMIDVTTGANYENTYEEAMDEEMNIEDWMLDEFDIDPEDKDSLNDEKVKEEEMEVEDWMLNIAKWLATS